MAKNLSEGHGFTIPMSVLNDPAIIENVYHPSAMSPLYSLIAAPLLWLFPGNYFLVTMIIEILSWLFLFIILYRLLFRLTADYFWTHLFIIFSGFFLYNIEQGSPYKDVLAIALLFLGLLESLRIGEGAIKPGVRRYLLTGILFILPGLLKLTYLPLAICFPLSVLWIGLVQRKKLLLQQGTILFFVAASLLATHYFFFRWYSASNYASFPTVYSQFWSMSTRGNDFIPGFFPENLRQMYPFIPATFLNLDLIGVTIQNVSGSLVPIYARILFVLQVAGLLFLVTVFFRVSAKNYKKLISRPSLFLLMGLFITGSIFLMLCIMSVKHQAIVYKGNPAPWTYVSEIRPYIFPIIFLQLVLFVFLFTRNQQTHILKLLRISLMVVMGIWAIHGFYFVAKTALKSTTGIHKARTVNQSTLQILDSLGQKHPGQTTWLATEIQHLDWYAKLNGQKTLRNIQHLNDHSFRLPDNTALLTVISKEDTTRISGYLQLPGVLMQSRPGDAVLVFYQSGKK